MSTNYTNGHEISYSIEKKERRKPERFSEFVNILLGKGSDLCLKTTAVFNY